MTSVSSMKNGLEMVTLCGGRASGLPATSPIVNEPAGTSTMPGGGGDGGADAVAVALGTVDDDADGAFSGSCAF
ncbi:MAG: hypothetical protein ABI548_21825 [Polyangiaceae bacterium]